MVDMTPKERTAYEKAAVRIAWAKSVGYTELDLSFDDLVAIPDTLGELIQLKTLDLEHNNLATIPDTLGKLTQLQTLYLNDNCLTAVPDTLGELTQLQTLRLNGNKLTAVPESLGKLTQLQKFDLSHNELKNVPDCLSKLTQLQSLKLNGIKLKVAPDWLGKLTQLKTLNLGNNELLDVPKTLSELNQLKTLYLNSNKLTAVPDALRKLTQLEVLNLSYNKLMIVPNWLGELTQLQALYLDSVKLMIVPDWLMNLTQLRMLSLHYNKLTAVPDRLVELPQLESLYISDNPITQPPPEQLGDALTDFLESVNLEAVRRYYAQLRRAGQAFFYEAKLLLIGEGGAGKTSLARKLVDSSAELPLLDESTEGIDILKWEFPVLTDARSAQDPSGLQNPKGLNYQANIWDFGGQSIYHATHQLFLSKRSVYVLLADTRRQHTDFYDWLRMQEAFGEDSPIILLKNKNRQHGNQCIIENLPHLRERFPNLKKIIELDLNNVPDEDEWPTLLYHLQKQLLALDHIGIPRPKTWVSIRQTLNDDKRDSISRRQFLALCAEHGIKDPKDALQLSDYLHHVGDILHFEDDPILTDLVILKPTWALDAIYRVLDNEVIAANGGEFSRQQLRELWHEAKYDNHREQLLRLMQKFKLCYVLHNVPDNFIAPQLLTPEAPAYDWDGDVEDLQLRYHYPIFMPRGILSRAIVALHHRIEDQQLVWRTGVILRDEFARAEMLELRGEREIRIRVSGGNRRDLLMEIVRAMDDLHRGFSAKLKYEKLVPCRCATCGEASESHFFTLGKLLERLSHRKETIECNNPPYTEVQIRSLIDDVILQTAHRDGPSYVGGDYINVGNIQGARGIDIGGSAGGSVITPSSDPEK